MEETTGNTSHLFNSDLTTTLEVNRVNFPAFGHDIIGAVLTITALIGIFANSFGILIFAKHKHLRSPTNLFVAGLALCDLLMLVLAIPFTAMSSFSHHWVGGYPTCVFEGFLMYFLGLTSLYLLCAISIDRYIVIALPMKSALVTKRVAVCAIIGCYGLGFFWAMLPLLGWNSYQLEGLMTSCAVLWDTKNATDYSYNVVIFFTCFIFPIIIMCFCYHQVYRTVRAVSRNNKWDASTRVTKRKLKLERKIAITVLIMIVVFFVCWTPYAIVSFWAAFGNSSDIPLLVAGLPPYIAKTACVWNPIIYICTNKQFRTAFLDIFPCKTSLRNSTESNEMNNFVSARVGTSINPEVSLRYQNERPDDSDQTKQSNASSNEVKHANDEVVKEFVAE